MKRLTTILCSFFFMVSGAFLAMSQLDVSMPGNQIAQAAAPLPMVIGKLPLELGLKSEERTVADSIKHDTVLVTKTVYKRVQKLKCITDTLVLPMPMPGPMTPMPVCITSGDREERTLVSTQSPKQSAIRLIVDDRVVYETGNDNSSAESGP